MSQAHHNDFIFRREDDGVRLIRDFEGMYAQCEDPHGQSHELTNLSYQLVAKTLQRAVTELTAQGQRDLSILDIGCGLGYFTGFIKHLIPQAFVCGIDIAASALAKAARIAPDCVFEVADLKAPSLSVAAGRSFHIAVALDSLYYFRDDEIGQVLRNIVAVLAQDGFLLVGYHLPEQMSFGRYIRSVDDARALMYAHGMRVVYSFDVHNDLDQTYAQAPIGRHLYFLARKGV
jgi:trans-aconitate methyltransferase